MAKVAPEIILDPGQLPNAVASSVIHQISATPKVLEVPEARETGAISQHNEILSKPLPKALAEFQNYVDSKLCYHSKPLKAAELISVQPKAAFQCHMKILFETRTLCTETTRHRWNTNTVMGSRTLGKLYRVYPIT